MILSFIMPVVKVLNFILVNNVLSLLLSFKIAIVFSVNFYLVNETSS